MGVFLLVLQAIYFSNMQVFGILLRMKNDKKTKTLLSVMVCTLLATVCVTDAKAELVVNSWDEYKKVHVLRRPIPVAVNVYAKDGTIPQVVHEEGVYAGVEYDMLRVDPSEYTFLQVDYSPSPVLLNSLYDQQLVNEGYSRVGGINASFFSQYGPVGALRIDNGWAYAGGTELTPSYGNGYATAYFNNTDMVLKYHGWAGSAWIPYDDGIWTGEQTGVHAYGLDSEFAVSGSYTYFADGIRQDLTGALSASGYGSTRRAVSILAQKADSQYLLLSFFGHLSDAQVIEFLEAEGDVTDAIRFDGGGSTALVYEDTLVNLPYVRSDYPERVHDTPLFGWGAVSAGYPETEHLGGTMKIVTVYSEGEYLFENEIPAGSTFSLIGSDGEYLLDHAEVDTSLNLYLQPTSHAEKNGVLEGNTLYYYNQEEGIVRDYLLTGSETDVVLMLLRDGEIPEKDSFEVNFLYGDEVVSSYRGNEPLTARITGPEGSEDIVIGPLDTTQDILLEAEEVKGMTVGSWNVTGTAREPVFEPVYEEKPGLSLTDSVKALVSSLFG